MALSVYKQDNYALDSDVGLGANSLTLANGRHFVVKAAGVVGKAVTGGVISGVSYTQDTFASDNQTVAKAKVEFEPETTNNEYQATFDGDIAITDEAKFYDIVDSQNIDQSTASATTGQVQLVKFLSAREGVVRIVNA